MEETELEEKQIQVLGRDGEPACFIGVYEVDTVYGGPEEGGWWYDTGELIRVEVVHCETCAIRRTNELREEYPDTGKRTSFGRDKDDWSVVRVQGRVPEAYYPETVPHYE